MDEMTDLISSSQAPTTLHHADLYTRDSESITFLVMSSLLYFIIGFVAMVGNTFVIFQVCRQRSLHKPTYYLIASLSVADLLTGTVALPLGAYGRIAHNAHVCSEPTDMWFFTMAYYLHCVSVMQLTAIAIDRYICITRPLQYINLVTPKRIAATITVLWTGCVLLGLLPLYRRNGQEAMPCSAATYTTLMYYFPAIAILVFLITLCFIYCIIFRIARRQVMRIAVLEQVPNRRKKPTKIRSSQMKATKTTLLVLCVFAVCWLPISVKFLMEVHLKTTENTLLYLRTAFEIVAYTNAALNPFVYVYRDRNFRGVLKHYQPKPSSVSL